MNHKRNEHIGYLLVGLTIVLPALGGCLPQPANQPPLLIVANYSGDGVLSYGNSGNLDGNVPPDATLAGMKTQLDTPVDVAVNGAGQLLVCNSGTDAITVYGDAWNAGGDRAPVRSVSGPQTKLNNVQSIAIDPLRDLLYVSINMSILVFAGTSTSAFNGNVAPARQITSASFNGAVSIRLDSVDNLYLANDLGRNILVFPNASSLNGPATPRVLTNAAISAPESVFVDRSDNLFVLNRSNHQLMVFRNAATFNGAMTFSVSLTLLGFSASGGTIAVDSRDKGYLADFAGNAVYVYDNIGTRNGTTAPDRAMKGSDTALSGPIGMFLLEK